MNASRSLATVLAILVAGCGGVTMTATPDTPTPTRVVHSSHAPVLLGAPIEPSDLAGRIVFDDFEDVYLMDVDGGNLVTVAGNPVGPEFDGSLSPDGAWVVYRDSTRGINDNDEIFIVAADGTGRRNLTEDPANDWGPAWSPDGTSIAFNSDRNLGAMGGYVIALDDAADGARRLEIEGWVEYPSFSPDGTRLVYMGAVRSNYEIFVADLASGEVTQLTHSPGRDGWPVWSPDGSTIAFTTVRDDCSFAPDGAECWTHDAQDEHSDVWLMDVDGSNQRRLTGEYGQFVAWSPDSAHLLISGYALYAVRADGSGRLELRADGFDLPLGGIPDWR